MQNGVTFVLDDQLFTIDFSSSGLTPTTTVLNFLRGLPDHKGVKEGCAEGDCGACTVVVGDMIHDDTIRYRSVDSCLFFLPMLHGKQLLTVENLKDREGALHPVQQSMVETNGSQCGFCTPGIIMSLFALFKNGGTPSREEIDDALTGNLCRCTGYKPIVEAAARSCVNGGIDHLTKNEHEILRLLQTIPRISLHITSQGQDYHRPVTLGEAVSLKASRPEAIVLCGATDVALRVTKKHEVLKDIIDLSGVNELNTIHENEQNITFGAAVALTDVMSQCRDALPALHEMLAVFGSLQIRNLATLGGNLGTASPIGDTLPALMVYNAKVILQSTAGSRELLVNDFFKGYRQTDRRADELITAVVVPKPSRGTIVKAYKVSKRKDLDISTLSGGFRIQINRNKYVQSIRLAYGGMADRVKRARAVEQFLIGKKWERATIEQAMPLVDNEFSPISDVRGSAEFRRVAARNLLMKFWSDTAQ
jgi:xanthine dehydrogenase small subunit